jgi:hypothetical protein
MRYNLHENNIDIFVYLLFATGRSASIIALLKILSDRKVTQPKLKYSQIFSMQYSSIGLINTQYRCDYTRAHAGHVMM